MRHVIKIYGVSHSESNTPSFSSTAPLLLPSPPAAMNLPSHTIVRIDRWIWVQKFRDQKQRGNKKAEPSFSSTAPLLLPSPPAAMNLFSHTIVRIDRWIWVQKFRDQKQKGNKNAESLNNLEFVKNPSVQVSPNLKVDADVTAMMA